MNERFVSSEWAARVELAHEPDVDIGAMHVCPAARQVIVKGRAETLEPRVMQVLVALVRAKGAVVSRDDLIEACWEGRIVNEDAISRTIAQLRKLADASGNVFSIETVARVGYRLRAAEPTSSADLLKRAPLPPSAGMARTKWIAAVSAALLLVLVAAGGAAWRFWPKSAAGPIEVSVAVLPFVNMSGDPKQEYFSDGFSEELVNDLSNNPHLRVASRTGSFAFKGRNQDIETIARALRVRAIVEGSVRESGDRVRVTAQMIDASDGYSLWSATYTRNMTDVLSVQDELARAIASALTHKLIPASPVRRPKIEPAVYRAYLEGIRQFNTAPAGWRRSFAIFKQVTVKAPDFADGFAWLSRVAVTLANNGDGASISTFTLASDAAQRALSLDPHNVMALMARATAELDTWQWRASASDMRKLQNENPNSFHTIRALWNFFMDLGFPAEAFAAERRLYVLEPGTYLDNFFTLSALDFAGHLNEEIGLARAQLVHRPRDAARLGWLCGAYAATGRVARARAIDERLRRLQTDGNWQANLEDANFP